jgi:5-methylcytosine-specific restriction enzyme A
MGQPFEGDDERYQAWLRLHPDGFVLNTRRTPSGQYVVLHRATCSRISAYTRKTPPGAFTERGYIKVCAADVSSLKQWIRARFGHDAAFSSVRCHCKPAT